MGENGRVEFLCYRRFSFLCPLANQVVSTPGPASSVYRSTTHSSYRSIHDTLYRSNRIASIDRYRVALDYPLTSLSSIPVSSKFPNRERPIPRNRQKGGRLPLGTRYSILLINIKTFTSFYAYGEEGGVKGNFEAKFN